MTAVLYATQNAFAGAAVDAIYLCRQAMFGLAGTARTYTSEVLAACGSLIERRRARTAEPRFVVREPAPLGIEGQWQRVTGVMRAAIASFRDIQTFQATAARQIDAADYALQLLIKDLAVAMPIPADGSELRAVLAEAAKTPAAAARTGKRLAA
jgi:hypothetical protein